MRCVNMTYLNRKHCYLGGPIENDSGPDWRPAIKEVLLNRFGIEVFDPACDPKQQFVPEMLAARNACDFKTMRKHAKQFVRKDLCVVDRSDFIITRLPKGVPTTGSIHEIIDANDRKKPVLLVCPEGKQHLPFWLYGFIRLKYMFGSFDELYAYLDKVHHGKCKKDDRWAFVYGLI